MNDMIAYCGLDCAECKAYKATVANDDGMRKETAREWSEMFGGKIEAESINCLGCKSEVRFSHCTECGIRSCGISHAAENCAECSDYGCAKIEKFISMAPEARTNLEKIRQEL